MYSFAITRKHQTVSSAILDNGLGSTRHLLFIAAYCTFEYRHFIRHVYARTMSTYESFDIIL